MAPDDHASGRRPVDLGPPTPERRDAAASRQRILDAARRLLAERGPAELTMNEVAAAAGVGVGTVYRRFGDLAHLLHAVLDLEEAELQQRLLFDRPDDDRHRTHAERISRFLLAHLDHVATHADLLYQADTAAPGARLRYGSYAVHHAHLARLLAEAAPELDADYTADLLLAAADAELYVTQRRTFGMEHEQIRSGLSRLVTALVGEDPPPARRS